VVDVDGAGLFGGEGFELLQDFSGGRQWFLLGCVGTDAA
jgi:hypothetical protein